MISEEEFKLDTQALAIQTYKYLYENGNEKRIQLQICQSMGVLPIFLSTSLHAENGTRLNK